MYTHTSTRHPDPSAQMFRKLPRQMSQIVMPLSQIVKTLSQIVTTDMHCRDCRDTDSGLGRTLNMWQTLLRTSRLFPALPGGNGNVPNAQLASYRRATLWA